MAEYPILFNGAMVRAILDGRKTQTRRVMKPQPKPLTGGWIYDGKYFVDDDTMWDYLLHNVYGEKGSPYGSLYGDGTGDLLWVRETWAGDDMCGVVYRVDHPNADISKGDLDDGEQQLRFWRPSIHMPRWASRITLRVTDVRVERVQEISEDDAQAEGVDLPVLQLSHCLTARYTRVAGFRHLWDSINAARGFGWKVNPWVWVVSFERVTP